MSLRFASGLAIGVVATTIGASLLAVTTLNSPEAARHTHEALSRVPDAGGDGDESSDVSQDVSALTGFASLLVTFTIILEKCTHTIDKALASTPHLLSMVYKLYRELMVLGLVSFIFFMIEVSGAGAVIFSFLESQQSDDLSAEALHFIFEIVHIGLFLGMVVFVLLGALWISYTQRISKFWAKAEKRGYAASIDRKQLLVEAKQNAGSRCWFFFTHPFAYFAAIRRAEYHDIRKRFIVQQNLYPGFRFNRYLTRCLRRNILALVDIHWSVWATGLVFLILNWLRYRAREVSTTVGGLFAVGYGYTMLAVVLLTYRKLDRIIKRIMKDEIIDTPPQGGSLSDLTLAKSVDPDGDKDRNRKKLVKQFSKGRLTKEKIQAMKQKKKEKTKSSSHHHRSSIGHPDAAMEAPSDSSSDESGDEDFRMPAGMGPSRLRRYDDSGKRIKVEPTTKKHKRLFWFRSPTFTLRLIQVCLLFSAFYFGAIFYYYRAFSSLAAEGEVPFWAPYAITIATLIPPVTVQFLLTPVIVPTYTMACSLGGLVNERILFELIDNDRRRVKQRLGGRYDLDKKANELLHKTTWDNAADGAVDVGAGILVPKGEAPPTAPAPPSAPAEEPEPDMQLLTSGVDGSAGGED